MVETTLIRYTIHTNRSVVSQRFSDNSISSVKMLDVADFKENNNP